MLKLHGFPLSNYFNKVKLALLEKGIPFEVVAVPFGGPPNSAGKTPLGKVPYIETEHGFLCESQAILDYIEARWPKPALMPSDPWAAAKVREIIIFMDWHVEVCARQLYPQAFFGATLPDKFMARVRDELPKRLDALKRLAVFGPYAAGDTFSMADCAVYASLPLVGLTTKAIYGEDLVLAAGLDWKAYAALIEQRPNARLVASDRKADLERTRRAIAERAAPLQKSDRP